jgi:uncharacterized protein (TIGR00269 family)
MSCCNQKPVIILEGSEKLCKFHFTQYFENKVLKTIRKFNLIDKEEKLGVAVSGGKDSLTLLSILKKISFQNPKIELTAIAIDEGIEGYRDKALITARKFCNENEIGLNVYSYKDEFGMSLDKILKFLNVKPCSICGTFRRYLLNKKSRELSLTKLATGHNLDDECQSILMNQFKNNIQATARLGPKVGISCTDENNRINNNNSVKIKDDSIVNTDIVSVNVGKKLKNKKNHVHVNELKYTSSQTNNKVHNNNFVQRIKPLYLCTEKEVTTYAFLNGILDDFKECPNAKLSYRANVRDMLNDFEAKFPGTKYSIANSFLGILPDLKAKFKEVEYSTCAKCGEPSSKDICNTCKFVELLNEQKSLSLNKSLH